VDEDKVSNAFLLVYVIVITDAEFAIYLAYVEKPIKSD